MTVMTKFVRAYDRFELFYICRESNWLGELKICWLRPRAFFQAYGGLVGHLLLILSVSIGWEDAGAAAGVEGSSQNAVASWWRTSGFWCLLCGTVF